MFNVREVLVTIEEIIICHSRSVVKQIFALFFLFYTSLLFTFELLFVFFFKEIRKLRMQLHTKEQIA